MSVDQFSVSRQKNTTAGDKMCGRYFFKVKIEDLIDRYGLYLDKDISLENQGEIFPTQTAAVIIRNNNKNRLEQFKWGFTPSFTNRPIINSRSETIASKKMFKKSFYNKRCIIPANSFFEWKKSDSRKIKYRIFLENEPIFSLAAIYDSFKDNNGNKVNCFSILTTEPNNTISAIHNRMPVIIRKSDEKNWLNTDYKDKDGLKKLLKPYPDQYMKAEPDDQNQQLSLDF